ncbi:MAG: STAS domain-containing protein [Sporolactobacillus sp.]
MEITIEEQKSEELFRVFVAGEIDVYTAPELKQKLLPLTESNDVILDLTGTGYIDSTALGVIIAALKKATKNGYHFSITGMSPRIERLFRVTGLTAILQRRNALGGENH